jgi:hypothetical protein
MKHLFLVFFVVLSGAAYALTGTSDPKDIPITITASGGIACDSGVSMPSIPVIAQRAGFTHCVLGADFTNSFYSNPNTWIYECNGGVLDSNHAAFFSGAHSGGGFSHVCLTTAVSGSQITVETDAVCGGCQVVHMFYNPSIAYPGSNGTDLYWPSQEGGNGSVAGGPHGTGLYLTKYVEYTFRMSLSSFNCNRSIGDCLPSGPWEEHTFINTAGPPPYVDMEVDYIEQQTGFCSNAATGLCNWHMNMINTSPSFSPQFNLTQYVTAGFVETATTAGGYAVCGYANAGMTLTATTPFGCLQTSGWTADNFASNKYSNLAWWAMNNFSGAQSGNVDFYIARWQDWECSTYWDGTCFGSLITSTLDPETYKRVVTNMTKDEFLTTKGNKRRDMDTKPALGWHVDLVRVADWLGSALSAVERDARVLWTGSPA